MRIKGKLTVLAVMTLLLLFALAVSASADITSVRNLGNGSVEVQWDNMDDMYLCMTVKMSNDYNADSSAYGYRYFDTEGKRRAVLYWFAPGQSYWVFTRRTDGTFTRAYAYDVREAAKFDDFKTQPHFTVWQLVRKDANGSQKTVNYFDINEVENNLNMISVGMQFRYTWPQLKNERSYLGQGVITSPEGDRYVKDTFDQTLPAGRGYYAYNNYDSLDEYFQNMKAMRGYVPVGTYYFSIYWDGRLVCSETFRVR